MAFLIASIASSSRFMTESRSFRSNDLRASADAVDGESEIAIIQKFSPPFTGALCGHILPASAITAMSTVEKNKNIVSDYVLGRPPFPSD